jgi:hypothetical protein
MTWIASICAATPEKLPDTPGATEQLAKLDLVAQRAMVCWAEWAFLATSTSVIVSAVALIGLFSSLRQTKRAIRDNREIGEVEAQAYVHAASAKFGETNNILIACKNTGATPASHFSVNGTAKVVKRGAISGSIAAAKNGFKTWPALGPGEELTVSIDNSRELIKKFLQNRDQDDILLVSGSIIYCTIFNHDHVTDYAFFVDNRSPTRFRRPVAQARAFHRLNGEKVAQTEADDGEMPSV